MHILVKWPGVNMLDVYPVDSLQDIELGLSISYVPAVPANVDIAKGKTFLIRCSKNAEPSEAFFVAAEHNRKIEELEHANARLTKKAKEKCVMTNMVDQMENLIQTASSQNAAAVTAAPMLDIGLGVCVDAGVLHRIERSSKGDRTRLARALIWAVFSPEEMIGRTSYGIPCNAH
ncbi:uncharacterized protein LOC135373153 [Ornithodoros turicata]|uniref:uncharacterized protein LOC135373153 n=1 Tax=Ornithodoros turicata TaxID=34597 RepID=UPI003139FC74